MKKDIKVKFSNEAKDVYLFFKNNMDKSKEDRMLFEAIERIRDRIQKDPFCGDPISKNKIPKYYKERYGVRGLFRIELPLFWRMLYTIKGEELQIISFVVDILDHKKYNKKFGYKKK